VFQPYRVRSPIDSGVRRPEERSSRQDPLYRRPYEFERFVIKVLIRARVWNSVDVGLPHQRRLVVLCGRCRMRAQKRKSKDERTEEGPTGCHSDSLNAQSIRRTAA
jgi:hypothetical protein